MGSFVSRQNGDTFQARVFFLYALKMLRPDSNIASVQYERGPKGFDDIGIHYQPERGPLLQTRRIAREHIQCKWHQAQGAFGYQNLTSPDFIHASSISLLQKVLHAVRAGDGLPLLCLRTNWRIQDGDPLAELRRMEDGRLSSALFDDKQKSNYAKLRQCWHAHLEDASKTTVSKEEFKQVIAALVFDCDTQSLEQLRENIAILASVEGLRSYRGEAVLAYDELVWDWAKAERGEFTAHSLRERLREAGQYASASERLMHHPDRLIGMRDRILPIYNLENFARDAMLDLVGQDWESAHAQLKAFLLRQAQQAQALGLFLDLRYTLSFAAGSFLNNQAGKPVFLWQRGRGGLGCFWYEHDQQLPPDAPQWLTIEVHPGPDPQGPDYALSVSLSNEAASATDAYLQHFPGQVGKVLHARIEGGAGQGSVQSGTHALALVEKLLAQLSHIRPRRDGRLHLFLSTPNTFAFYLGQYLRNLGEVVLYEYDLDLTRPKDDPHRGSYKPSLCLYPDGSCALA